MFKKVLLCTFLKVPWLITARDRDAAVRLLEEVTQQREDLTYLSQG